MKNSQLFVFAAIIALSSCHYKYDYAYQVTNNTDSEVKIELKSRYIDSSYIVSAGETKILFVTTHGYEGPKGPYYVRVLFDLYEFKLSKDTFLISTKDYLDSSSWKFNEGLYSTEIYNSEFVKSDTRSKYNYSNFEDLSLQ